MANTNLFIMSKGEKPGNTPAHASGNVYYDCPTNPLLIYNVDLLDSGVYVNGAVNAGAQSYITVDLNDGSTNPIPEVFKVGDSVYDDTGTLVGVVTRTHSDKIELAANTAVYLANNEQLKSTYKSTANRIVCYEIRGSPTDGVTNPTASATNGNAGGTSGGAEYGVSNSATFTVLNRQYPSSGYGTSTQIANGYLQNRETSPSYRIEMDYTTPGTPLQLSTSLLNTNDYFVTLFVDEPKKQHMAKITEITTSDAAGDSFEFTPAYTSDIPSGTKYAIYKGPLKTDTNVVAIAYGLAGAGAKYTTDTDETDGTGFATDTRHSEMTYVATPNFYFYNDRLNKENELDHNSKYILHYSRSEGTTEVHWQRCFITTEDFGQRVKDYSKYELKIDLVDELKTYDDMSADGAATAKQHYGSSATGTYSTSVSDWNDCFLNLLRDENDEKSFSFDQSNCTVTSGDATITHPSNGSIIAGLPVTGSGIPVGTTVQSITDSTHFELSQAATASSTAVLTFWTSDAIGPKRYLHYASSPQKVTGLAHVIDLDIFESITKTGTYMSLTLADPKRIYSKKIKENDKIRIYKTLDSEFISDNYTHAIFGTVTGTTSSTTLTFSGLEDGQDLRLLLRSSSNYDTIRIGKYNYRITAVGAPSGSAATQTITIDAYKLTTASSWTTGISGAAETITAQIAYRRAWSPITKTLMVDFNIDTIANYSATSVTAVDDSLVTFTQGDSTITYVDSKLYQTQLQLIGGEASGLRIPVLYGDQKNSFLKLDSTVVSQQLYLPNSATSDMLAYYSGTISLEKKVFEGYIELIEDYIEDGQYKLKLQGRNEISKLLGPIVNKNYSYSDDIIYSSLGMYFNGDNDAIVVVAYPYSYRLGDMQIKFYNAVSSEELQVGDLIFQIESGSAGYGNIDAGNFVGEISSISEYGSDPGDVIVNLLDGALCSFTHGTHKIVRKGYDYIFAKAMEHTSNILQTPTSLDNTSSKGLFFTSGKALDSNGLATTNLINTSIHSNSEAVGYPIHNPKGISSTVLGQTDGDSAFMASLRGTIDGVSYNSSFDVPNAISDFVIVSVDSNEGKGIIRLAPVSPIILARSDEDVKNTTGEILADSGLTFDAVTSTTLDSNTSASKYRFFGTYANVNIGDALYNSSGKLFGKVRAKYTDASAATAATTYYIILDRNPNESGITEIIDGEKIYTIENRYTHNISLLNTQGINNGAILQLMSHSISPAGNTLPFNYFIKHNNEATYAWGDADFIEKYGSFMFRLYDIHHFKPGSVYKSKRLHIDERDADVNTNKEVYATDTGKLQGFGKSYRFRPWNSSATIPHTTLITTKWDGQTRCKEMAELPPDARNVETVRGGNFENYTRYNKALLVADVHSTDTASTFNANMAARASADIVLNSITATGVYTEGTHLFNFNGDFLGIVKSVNPGSNTITLFDVNENAVASGTKPRVNIVHIRQTYPNGTTVNETVNNNTYPLWEVYPKLLTLANRFDWAYKPDGTDASSGGEHLGFTLNGLNRAQDYLELIDPKCTKYYLFGKSDLYPECANRKQSLFYGNRDITDYNLMLKSKGEAEESTVPDGYSGAASRQTYKDDSYETVVIEQSNKELNELSRYNLMRLIEVTYDSHFNLIDPENPPPIKSGIEAFKYTTFNPVELVTGSSTNPYITAYNTDSGTERTNFSYTGDANNLANGDYLFTNDGFYLGRIATSNGLNYPSSGKITNATGRWNYGSHGYEYKGPIYKVSKTGGNSFLNFDLIGRAGQDTLSGSSKKPSRFKCNLMQGAVHNPNGSGARDETENYDTSLGTQDNIMHPLVGVCYLTEDVDITYNGTNTGATTSISINGDPTGIICAGDIIYDGAKKIGIVSSVVSGTITLKSNKSALITTTNTNNVDKYESILGNSTGEHSSVIMNHMKFTAQYKAGVSDHQHIEHIWQNQRIVILERHPLKEEGGADAPIKNKTAAGMNILPSSTFYWGHQNKADVRTKGVQRSSYWFQIKDGIGMADYKGDGWFAGWMSGNVYMGDGTYFVNKPLLFLDWNQAKGNDGARLMDDGYERNLTTTTTTGTHNTTTYGGTLNVTDATSFADSGTGQLHGEEFTWTNKTSNTLTGCSGLGGGMIIGAGSVIIGGSKKETLLLTVDNDLNTRSSLNAIDEANIWLDYAPNLTGYYLVSCEGVFTDSPDAEVLEDVDASWWNQYSSAEISPSRIHYVISHIKSPNQNGSIKHLITIDNPQYTGSLLNSTIFRVMRTAEICTYDFTPKEIPLYTLSSRTTKKPYEKKTYDTIPNFTFVSEEDLTDEDGNVVATTYEPLHIPRSELGRPTVNGANFVFSYDASSGENWITNTTDSPFTEAAGWSSYEVDFVEISGCANSNNNRVVADRCYARRISDTKIEIKANANFSGSTSNPNFASESPTDIEIKTQNPYVLREGNDGILSMYVMVDPDNTSNSEYLIPREHSDNWKLFGDESEDKPLKNGTYPFTLTDGHTTYTTNIKFSSPLTSSSKNNRAITARFAEMKEMIGCVSLGTPFTIITPRPIKLRDIKSAKIGTTVTICNETEDIIEDILENENITYTDSTTEYPKYIAPNFQGVDVFTASNYLAKLKKKRLTIDVDTIKLEKTDANLRFLPIEISEDKSDEINIISVKKKKAAYDFYNHITVYGRGVKSTARNPKSIKKIGKKAYEEFDNKLATETEVNERARALLATHSDKAFTVKIETSTKGLEHLKAGDIVTIELPRENIERGPYLALQIDHTISGNLSIIFGAYSKSMDVRLAELLAENKKVAAYLRGNRFKGNLITNELVDTIKIKTLKIKITKTTTSSTGTFIGFTTPMNTGTYTMGFTGLGQTTTTLLEKDL